MASKVLTPVAIAVQWRLLWTTTDDFEARQDRARELEFSSTTKAVGGKVWISKAQFMRRFDARIRS